MKPKRLAGVKAKVLPDGYVLLRTKDSDCVYTLSPIGAIVWEFCDGSNSIDELLEEMKALPDLKVEKGIREQVIQLIEDLKKQGLLSQ